MNPITLDVNKTTTFLLPMLFPDSTHDEIFSNYFKQAYVGLLDDADDLDYNIVLEFDEDKITPDSLEDFTSNISAHGELKSVEGNLITYLFNADEHSKFQYEQFLVGGYSKLAPQTKLNIIDFWKEDQGGGTLLHGILYNTPEIVDEYTPHLNREIIQELEDTNGESWPPPNLFVDEFLVV